MLFTHHSHSGQFCTHAVSTLEEVIQAAIQRGMTHICLTEHIPRPDADLYPEESSHALLATQTLQQVFTAYIAEAQRLQSLYAPQIHILLGFETEWIRPSSLNDIRALQAATKFDIFMGSIHHVHTYPIDYDDATLAAARDASGGTDELLAEAYFDAQLEMLNALHPPVVGHFDLIRLKAAPENRDRDWRKWGDGVWKRIVRNLEVVKGYGGVLEVNSAALRKGLADVYPRREIMEVWSEMGGRLTLSDDSHGVEQLCTNYAKALDCVGKAGIGSLWYAEKAEQGLVWKAAKIEEVRARLR
ncbi:histidinol phosphate phosphatase H [Myriangium duriaei CBS 260.36]|uniref:Histidinol-phosphatase n=1 Tax=Myriangium duriaei CBS 260.36 TaxID=1168546 RepID=A0A9P4IUZ4_9PEZI|nr:histidinol phosphate phosphatase H [Myriangium duriaei CBS 260.36]